MNPIILKDLTIGYGSGPKRRVVLHDLDLLFEGGKVTGIVGLNGVGKSTLLRTMAGLQDPLSGEVRLKGQNITDLSVSEVAKRVSIVLTERFSGFNLTVYDAVASGRMPYTGMFHLLDEKQRLIVDEAMRVVGIKGLEGRLLNEISDGQFQKTMIARAICCESEILLLDEPTSFLDYKARHELFGTLRQLADNGKCVIVSSHDLDLVTRYCDAMLLLANDHAEMILPTDAARNPLFRQITGGYL